MDLQQHINVRMARWPSLLQIMLTCFDAPGGVALKVPLTVGRLQPSDHMKILSLPASCSLLISRYGLAVGLLAILVTIIVSQCVVAVAEQLSSSMDHSRDCVAYC